jgi:rhodanese-related sulfurtransferase
MMNIAQPTSKLHKAAIKRNKIWNWAVLLLVLLAVTSMGLASCSTAPAATIEAPNTVSAEISVDEAYQKYVDGVFFLDVRTPEEWDEYHAPNTTLIPLNELGNRLDELPQGEEIVVICRSGNRSQQGRDILRNNGFDMATSMAGGLNEWRAVGYPIE